MLESSLERLLDILPDEAIVLDIGSWASPLARADWVIDLMPYETRGLYGRDGLGTERFDKSTWIVRDVCDRQPLPFDDGEIDFVVCSHTLEDIRDPIWVCQEMSRVAQAGYIEVPSRLEEQCYGFQGPWTGWGHHRWLVDEVDGCLRFVFKYHMVHNSAAYRFPRSFRDSLSPEERVVTLWWDDRIDAVEEIFVVPGEVESYLEDYVTENLRTRGMSAERPARRTRTLAGRLRSLVASSR